VSSRCSLWADPHGESGALARRRADRRPVPQMTDLVLEMIQAMQRKGMPSFWWNIPWISLKMAQRVYVMSRGNCLGYQRRVLR
jgi:hypothetical protein